MSQGNKSVFKDALLQGLGGGLAGASAMAIQVFTLMPLRTMMNLQYRHGGSTREAALTLYRQGGVPRFYKGLLPALLQGPLSRFGDTAANTGVLALLEASESTRELPVFAKSAAASVVAGSWRVFLMPLDALKTTMQVEGKEGVSILRRKVAVGGFTVLYYGAFASFAASWFGHFPWFFTFNYLNSALPRAPAPEKSEWGAMPKLLRSAGIGFCSSVVSDTVSNSIRVIKTTKQTHERAITYPQAVREVIAKDGVSGLLFRGLKTRILANGMQGTMFAFLWKFFEGKFNAGK